MSVHPGNRDFTNPGAHNRVIPSMSSFDQMVETLHLSPHQYEGSPELKEWVRRHKDHKYVPTDVLNAFGFDRD
ncbi:MAG: hypothetical protein WBM11_19345 [Terriglobales bacterium]